MKFKKNSETSLFPSGLPKKKIKDRYEMQSRMCAALNRLTSQHVKGKLSLTARYAR